VRQGRKREGNGTQESNERKSKIKYEVVLTTGTGGCQKLSPAVHYEPAVMPATPITVGS
jgi:hypothetical protein